MRLLRWSHTNTCLILSCLVSCCPKTFAPTGRSGPTSPAIEDRKRFTVVEGDVWQCRVLHTPFGTGSWTLFTGIRGEGGLPIEAFLRLYARKDKVTVCVRQPTEFRNLDGIRLDSAEDALAFVHLFTDPETFYLFDSPGAIDVNQASDKPEQWYGVIPQGLYHSLRLGPPVVIEGSGCFTVTRYVLSAERTGNAYAVLRLEERVGRDGDYCVLSSAVIGMVPVGSVRVPMFE